MNALFLRSSIAILVAAALPLGCASEGPPTGATSVFLAIRNQPTAVVPDELRLTARTVNAVLFDGQRLPEAGELLPVGGSLLGTVTLYVGAAEGGLEIELEGRVAGVPRTRGVTTVEILAGHQVSAEVVLAAVDDLDGGAPDGGGDDGAAPEDDGGAADAGDGGAPPEDAAADAGRDQVGGADVRMDATSGDAPDGGPADAPPVDAPVEAGGGADGAGGDAGPAVQAFVRLAFDETGGQVASDSSGHNRDGTMFGGVTRILGRTGGAVHIDGMAGSYIALPANLLDAFREVTVAAWVRVGTARTYQKVFDFGNGSGRSMYFAGLWSNGTSRFAITTNGMASEQVLSGQTSVPAGTWTHVAVVLGPSGGTLYIDGAAVATSATVTLRPVDLAPTPNVWLGRSQMSTTPNLDGDVDDFRVYDRALTAAEVASVRGGSL